MFDAMEIRDEIDSMVANYRHDMPENIKALVSLAKRDLQSGPVYLDSDGDAVSCFDVGAKQFDIVTACGIISDWADCIADVQIETGYCEETDESQYESVDGSAERIKAELFGKTLAGFL